MSREKVAPLPDRSAMTRRSPPGKTEPVRASSALVLAPHYDDEVLGCGGLVTQLASRGAVVRVLFLSDSGGAVPVAAEREAYSLRRRQEADEAAEVLALAGVDHLGLPDGNLEQHLEMLVEGMSRALLSQRPELLLVPSPLEVSADHRAAFAALHRLLGSLRHEDPLEPLMRDLRILTYEINHPQSPDLLVDISDQVKIIERAMACYGSQLEQHDYLGACLGLSKFRTLTLPSGVEAAEAYCQLICEDFQTRSLARLTAELGGVPELLPVNEGPLISVIVRTKDRPELLVEALASLAASTYRRVEVVVVNDGGQRPSVTEELPFPLEIVDLETNRGRSGAANAGVAVARGEFVAFLDDDDLFDPEHLATLADAVGAVGVRVAYTDAAVGVYELGQGTGWHCVERRLPYSRDFDRELLLFDNYIPFNTLLIERRLFDRVGEFDENLPFFEDWDFLIRLAAETPFHHLARATCEYRHFRGGNHHILGDSPRRRADFLAMKARVIRKHALAGADDQGYALAQTIDKLRAEGVAEHEEGDRLRSELNALHQEFHQLNGKLVGLEAHQRVVEESENRTRSDLRQRDDELLELKQHVRELDALLATRAEDIAEQSATLRRTYDEIERLNKLIQAMESSRAWRLHVWLQRRKP